MNESTLLTTVKARLVAQTWTGGSNVVFPTGCVAITANVDLAMESALKTMRTPFALLQPLSSTSDPEFDQAPGLAMLAFQVRVMVMVPGDSVGENAVMGGNKTAGATYSEGRGLFEVEQEVFNAIGTLNANESLVIMCRQKGGANAAIVEGKTYVAWRDLQFEMLGTYV